ncbi:MAG: LPXTG cell wall anchor domain-containing protein, partial [Brevibacterium aurantiacum]
EPTDEPTEGPTDEPTDEPTPGGELPRTGVDTAVTLGAAGALLAIGGAVVLLTRRNRRG